MVKQPRAPGREPVAELPNLLQAGAGAGAPDHRAAFPADPGGETFRAALGVDDGTWDRARGFTLHQAALIIPYYPRTNPGFVALARRTVEQVLADASA